MLNETLQIISMVLCIVGIAQTYFGPKHVKRSVRIYYAVYASLFFYSVFILLGLTLKERKGEAVHTALLLSNFFEFLFGYILMFFAVLHLVKVVDPMGERKDLRVFSVAMNLILALQSALLVLSLFTGFCYYIDGNNVYQRGDGFWLLLLIWIAEYFIGSYVLIRYGKGFPRMIWLSLCILGGTIGVSFVLQVFFFGIYFITISTSISTLIIQIIIVNYNTEKYYQKERENDRLKVDIMLSQIQPHFVFNSLSVIKHLCRHDPELAEKAVTDFSYFLRGNMDSINSKVPVRFDKELEHTNAYLSLEKLRFGDSLTIEYDIETTDFYLPPLTLQPMVENAVRHGIRGTQDGKGTVVIKTRGFDDRSEITVSDDGAGFDANKAPDPDKPHIGIENVRYRLKNMCGGALSIDSEIGQGTVAVISVPKGDRNADLRNR